jgi:hypothetical protein
MFSGHWMCKECYLKKWTVDVLIDMDVFWDNGYFLMDVTHKE